MDLKGFQNFLGPEPLRSGRRYVHISGRIQTITRFGFKFSTICVLVGRSVGRWVGWLIDQSTYRSLRIGRIRAFQRNGRRLSPEPPTSEIETLQLRPLRVGVRPCVRPSVRPSGKVNRRHAGKTTFDKVSGEFLFQDSLKQPIGLS